MVNIVGSVNTLPDDTNIQSILYNSAKNEITITLNNTDGYSANNYISIDKESPYVGNFLKIKSVSGNTLIVDNNNPVNQTIPGGRISICSLYKFLKINAQENINRAVTLITNPANPANPENPLEPTNIILTNDKIIEATKNLKINKNFVDSFVDNFLAIENTIQSISKSVNIINNIWN